VGQIIRAAILQAAEVVAPARFDGIRIGQVLFVKDSRYGALPSPNGVDSSKARNESLIRA